MSKMLYMLNTKAQDNINIHPSDGRSPPYRIALDPHTHPCVGLVPD